MICFINFTIHTQGETLRRNENYFSGLPERQLMEFFCTAVDIKTTLSARQTALLVDIGHLLSEFTELLRVYDEAHVTIEHIANDILQPIQEAVAQNRFDVDLSNLQNYRSSYMPEMGQSFIEEQCFLLADLDDYLEANENAVLRSRVFFNDPLSLRAPGGPGL